MLPWPFCEAPTPAAPLQVRAAAEAAADLQVFLQEKMEQGASPLQVHPSLGPMLCPPPQGVSPAGCPPSFTPALALQASARALAGEMLSAPGGGGIRAALAVLFGGDADPELLTAACRAMAVTLQKEPDR